VRKSKGSAGRKWRRIRFGGEAGDLGACCNLARVRSYSPRYTWSSCLTCLKQKGCPGPEALYDVYAGSVSCWPNKISGANLNLEQIGTRPTTAGGPLGVCWLRPQDSVDCRRGLNHTAQQDFTGHRRPHCACTARPHAHHGAISHSKKKPRCYIIHVRIRRPFRVLRIFALDLFLLGSLFFFQKTFVESDCDSYCMIS
jgi:hypothetical protein